MKTIPLGDNVIMIKKSLLINKQVPQLRAIITHNNFVVDVFIQAVSCYSMYSSFGKQAK